MITSDSKPSAPKTLPPSALLKHTTELCNELDELITLHHFFYQAAEHFFSDQPLSFRRGLSLFPGWLRERDLQLLEDLHRIQQQLREGLCNDNSNTVS